MQALINAAIIASPIAIMGAAVLIHQLLTKVNNG
jgi:hypothetical protein